MPVFFKEVSGFKSEAEVIEGPRSTFVFGENDALAGGGVPSGHRLFVGGLSMNSSDDRPEVGDEVLVGFEHGERAGTHPDFLWAPDWIL
jgi:hypothetical protein